MCVASQSRAPQGRLKSPKFKSGLYTKFRDHGFLLTLERACEAQIWKGILRFRGVKSSKFFWPAGAAPQGRRGQDASRPARPRVAYFSASTSFGYRSTETLSPLVPTRIAGMVLNVRGCILSCIKFTHRSERQGRLKRANIEWVLLAGSSLFLCEPCTFVC